MHPTIDVACVQLWSTREATPEENRRHALAMLSEAAQMPSDLIVLPEAVSMLCYPDGRPNFTYRDVAEGVPGPTTEAACSVARRHEVNVVLGLIADRGPDVPCQNLAVVIDRSGEVVGCYEKTHEPEICRREQHAGRGDSLPVFDLDFGRIGLFICWDLVSPEVAAILAMKGAQILCFPHLIAFPAREAEDRSDGIADRATAIGGRSAYDSAPDVTLQMRARAIDHALPLVAAGMRDPHNHNGGRHGIFPTCIIDARGDVLAQSEKAGADVVRARVELAPPAGDDVVCAPDDPWSRRRKRELRPDLYAREYVKMADFGNSEQNESSIGRTERGSEETALRSTDSTPDSTPTPAADHPR